ncbi:MAG: ABC transporter permease, partial [Proteobacteria bacterium]|nr:ABC transporter permease [Pseudomonadota bacterium]
MRTPTHNRAPFLFAVTALTTVFMVAPMLLSIFAGLVNNYSVGLKSGFTLRWLAEVWDNYGGTVGASLWIAALCVLLTVLLGVPCAYALARSRSRLARAFEEILTLPVAVPGLATALALILAYGQIAAFRQSFAFILVGHVVFTLPFMVRTVASAFQR